MTVNQRLKEALSDLVKGNAWPETCPKETPPNEYIIYSVVGEMPSDYGDDTDLTWTQFISVHWIKKGNVNYTSVKNAIRTRLKEAGFLVTGITPGYDEETKSTHLVVSCNIIEEDYYGAH